MLKRLSQESFAQKGYIEPRQFSFEYATLKGNLQDDVRFEDYEEWYNAVLEKAFAEAKQDREGLHELEIFPVRADIEASRCALYDVDW
jgi:hypothetical protein